MDTETCLVITFVMEAVGQYSTVKYAISTRGVFECDEWRYWKEPDVVEKLNGILPTGLNLSAEQIVEIVAIDGVLVHSQTA